MGLVFITYCSLVAKSFPTLLQLHGLHPTRLFCPWDFPGKSTRVGCHFLLQETFPIQGSNPHLLPDRLILYHWATWEDHVSLLCPYHALLQVFTLLCLKAGKGQWLKGGYFQVRRDIGLPGGGVKTWLNVHSLLGELQVNVILVSTILLALLDVKYWWMSLQKI